MMPWAFLEQLSGADWATVCAALGGLIVATAAALVKYLPVKGKEKRADRALEARVEERAAEALRRETAELIDRLQDEIGRLQAELRHQREAGERQTAKLDKVYGEVRELYQKAAECLVQHERMLARVAVLEAVLQRTQTQEAVSEVATHVEAILVVDEHGIIRQWNEAATLLLHWKTWEARGQHLSVIVPPDKADAWSVARPERNVPRGPHQLEALTKHGDRVPVEVVLSSWEDPPGHWTLSLSLRKPVVDAQGRRLSEMPSVQQMVQETTESVSQIMRAAGGVAGLPKKPPPKNSEDADIG